MTRMEVKRLVLSYNTNDELIEFIDIAKTKDIIMYKWLDPFNEYRIKAKITAYELNNDVRFDCHLHIKSFKRCIIN